MNNLVKLSKKTAARLFLARVGAVCACAAICMSVVGITSPAAAQDNRTTYEYDGLGRLIKERRAAEGVDTTYSYDTLGNRITASDSLVVDASFSVDDVSVGEGGVLTFTVTKSGVTALSHDVSYATANGTASSNDYQATSGILSFAPSDATKTVSVQTTHNIAYENDETVLLNLSNPTNGATIADSQGVGTIIADDVNLPPVANNDTAGGEVNDFITVYPLSNDSDPNGHTLSLTSYSSSSPDLIANWNASQNKMTLTGVAPGSYHVDYTIIDGFGGSDSGRINVSVTFNGGGCPFPPCLPDF